MSSRPSERTRSPSVGGGASAALAPVNIYSFDPAWYPEQLTPESGGTGPQADAGGLEPWLLNQRIRGAVLRHRGMRWPVVDNKETLWRYREVRPYLMESGGLITAQEATRRVLMLMNPGLGGEASKACAAAGANICCSCDAGGCAAY